MRRGRAAGMKNGGKMEMGSESEINHSWLDGRKDGRTR